MASLSKEEQEAIGRHPLGNAFDDFRTNMEGVNVGMKDLETQSK
jgi:hypothetical protein